MKKLTFLLAIIIVSLTSFGQTLDNEFYIRAGYSSPSWAQYGADKDMWGNGTSKFGGIIELGSIFMIQSIPAQENMALGINVDYLYTIINDFSNDASGYNEHLTNFRVGSKIGPSFTYSPQDKMAIDVYVKADIAWGSVAVSFEDAIGDADDYYSDLIAVGLSTGVNFRYSVLMLGLEFNTISPKLESDDYPNEFFGNVDDDNSDKSPLPCFNITLGLSF